MTLLWLSTCLTSDAFIISISSNIIQCNASANDNLHSPHNHTPKHEETMKPILPLITLYFVLLLDRFVEASAASCFVPTLTHQIRSHLGSSTVQYNSRLPLIEAPASQTTRRINNRIESFTKSNVLVRIERTAQNERRISGELIVKHSHDGNLNGDHNSIGIDHLWNILTDYDNLSTHVPNLVESRIINRGSYIFNRAGNDLTTSYDSYYNKHIHEVKTSIGPRVYQKGAQKIWGFEFGADVTMDMRESVINYNVHHPTIRRRCILDFKCVSSQFFSQFDGSWIVEETVDPMYGGKALTTNVKYIVDVRPKGLVPVAALEWRIKEDVPTNMLGIVNAASKTRQTLINGMPEMRILSALSNEQWIDANTDWYRDETLSMYL